MLKSFNHKINDIAFVYPHTGSKPDKANRIYSVGAAILSPSKPKQVFFSHIHYPYLTSREYYYSNISKESILKAPGYRAVQKKLKAFLKNQNFIFTFDTFGNMGNVSDITGIERLIDLHFVTEFFLPHLESNSFPRIKEYLSGKTPGRISTSTEQAVDLSEELIRHICGTVLNNRHNDKARAMRYFLAKSSTLVGKALIHIGHQYQQYWDELFAPCSGDETADWMAFLEEPASRRSKKQEETNAYIKIPDNDIEDRFRYMTESLKGFKYRSTQTDYAKHTANALNNQSLLCIEAGTGTGKTLGYLIPVMEYLRKNKTAVAAVSTYTKNLQEQIFQREIKFTKEIFEIYRDIPVSLLKGKSSCICAIKLEQAFEDNFSGEQLLAWLYLVNLVYNFRNADIESISRTIKKNLNRNNFLNTILSMVSAKTGCSPRHKSCPAQVLNAEAARSRLIITNHNKLAWIDRDPMLSGRIKTFIIDEANHFEQAVRNSFRNVADAVEISGVLSYLHSMLRKIYRRTGSNPNRDIFEAINKINSLQQNLQELHRTMTAINPHIKTGEENRLEQYHPKFYTGQIQGHLDPIQKCCSEILNSLKFANDKDVLRSLKIVSRTASKIKTCIPLIQEFREALSIIEKSFKVKNHVMSYQLFKTNFRIVAAPVDVSSVIREKIYSGRNSLIYTSATMRNNGSFKTFKKIVGMETPLIPDETVKRDPVIFEFRTILSPFSPDRMEIIVPDNAVNGSHNNKRIWMKYISEMIPALIKQNNGRTLVLFASYDDLTQVAAKISESIPDTVYPFLIQQPGNATINLCDEFRTIRESVLFGVETFWYGVDFKGDTLTQVIITRIPYLSHNTPIQMARKETMSPRDYWARYYYDKDIKVQQGIGRLIRCDTDKGKVVILDSRYRIK